MASILAFNKLTIGSTTITNEEFVSGSGTLEVKPTDKTVNTADGKIHHWRISRSFECSARVHGDKRSLASAMGEAVKITVFSGTTQIVEFDGLVSVSLESDPDVSSLTITGSPELS